MNLCPTVWGRMYTNSKSKKGSTLSLVVDKDKGEWDMCEKNRENDIDGGFYFCKANGNF